MASELEIGALALTSHQIFIEIGAILGNKLLLLQRLRRATVDQRISLWMKPLYYY